MFSKKTFLLSVLLMSVLVLFMVGCENADKTINSDAPVFNDDSQTHDPPAEDNIFTLQTDSMEVKRESQPTAAASATYAYGLVQILDGNEGDYDWLVVFYLPYNPGNATFQGRAPWGWQTFSGSWAQVYETRWTSRGFRVKILIGKKVTSLCGTSSNRYRLVY